MYRQMKRTRKRVDEKMMIIVFSSLLFPYQYVMNQFEITISKIHLIVFSKTNTKAPLQSQI
jgi:hypothetical protein